MENEPSANLNRELRALFGEGRLADLGEGQLLDRFLCHHDEVAFAELIARHGPMVLGVCRRWLADPNDVDDAFQATFLILLRKGRSLRDSKTLSPWLYGVSQRVARRARSQAARRRERLVSTSHDAPTSRTAHEEAASRELLAIVDDEIRRLPEKQQTVAVLCLVQGWTHEEAARALEWPLGTVKSRLATAREALRERLKGRGLDAPDGLLAALPLSWRLAPAATLGRLSRLTQLAIDCVNRAVPPGKAATAGALELSRGVLRTMLWKTVLLSSACIVLAVSAAGGVALAYQREGRIAAAVHPDRSKALDPPIDGQKTSRPVQRDVLQIAYEQAERFSRSIEDSAERAEHLLSLGIARTRQGRLPEAQAILNEAVNAAANIPKNSHRIIPHPIIRIAEAQAEAGDREAAHRTFLRAVQVVASDEPGEQADNWINLIPRQLAIEGRARMAHTFAVYRRFTESEDGDAVRDQDTATALDAAQSGNPDSALKVIQAPTFGSDGPNPDHRRFLALFEVVSYFGPDERDRVRPLLSEARKLIDATDRVRTRSLQFEELAREEARLGLFSDAVASAEAIVTKNLPHEDERIQGFNCESRALLDIAEKQLRAGDQDGAKSAARRAMVVIDASKSLSHESFRLVQLADLLIRVEDLDAAREIINRISFPDEASYKMRRVARRQAKAGNHAAAKASWNRALEIAARGSQERTVTTAEIQAEMGDLARALRTLDTITDEAEKQEAFCSVAIALASVGNLDAVESVVAKITSSEVKDRIWFGIACGAPRQKSTNH